MTTQYWLTPQDSDSYVWYHWLAICVPHGTLKPGPLVQAGIYADGGPHTGDPAPDIADQFAGKFKFVLAELIFVFQVFWLFKLNKLLLIYTIFQMSQSTFMLKNHLTEDLKMQLLPTLGPTFSTTQMNQIGF